jgi:hypothetical protein
MLRKSDFSGKAAIKSRFQSEINFACNLREDCVEAAKRIEPDCASDYNKRFSQD